MTPDRLRIDALFVDSVTSTCLSPEYMTAETQTLILQG
jgi:hypothetical protein